MIFFPCLLQRLCSLSVMFPHKTERRGCKDGDKGEEVEVECVYVVGGCGERWRGKKKKGCCCCCLITHTRTRTFAPLLLSRETLTIRSIDATWQSEEKRLDKRERQEKGRKKRRRDRIRERVERRLLCCCRWFWIWDGFWEEKKWKTKMKTRWDDGALAPGFGRQFYVSWLL